MMNIQIRRLNEVGISEMSEFHRRIYRENSTEDPPKHLLHEDEFSETFLVKGEKLPFIDQDKNFETLMEMAIYLCGLFSSEKTRVQLLEDPGCGAWLSLLYFDQMCERKSGGRWNPNELARYIPDMSPRRYYRNHIFNSILMYTTHGKLSRILLYTPPSRLSEYSRFLAEQTEVVLNPQMIEVVDRLYWDEHMNAPKPGAVGSKLPHRDGALRRFAGNNSFVFQHAPTWDFWEMDAEMIIGMLPGEFNDWIGIQEGV